MARGSEMQQVDLEGVAADEDTAPTSSPGRRRARRWAVGVVALVVAALVAGQWVTDRREDAAVARLRALPGVVAAVDDHLVARPTSEESVSALWGGQSRVSLAEDGAQSFTWRPANGGRSWTVQLRGASAPLAVDGAQSSSLCQPDGAGGDSTLAERFIVCDVTDGGWVQGSDESEVKQTQEEVVVLDVSDGTEVARWRVSPHSSVAVIGDVVAVAGQDSHDAVVTGYAAATGTRRWVYRAADEVDEGDGLISSIYLSRAGSFLALQRMSPRVTLLRADGTAARTIGSGNNTDGSGYASCGDDAVAGLLCEQTAPDGAESVTLLADDADPAHDRVLKGGYVRASVDDGSVPGLVLTAKDLLTAWDGPSGRLLWRAADASGAAFDDRLLAREVLVVRGLVYVIAEGAPAAYDGRTGELRWTGKSKWTLPASGLLTDGQHVIATYEDGTAGSSFLAAFDLRSGERRFRAEYPTGVDHLTVLGRQLIGFREGSSGIANLFIVE